MKVWNLSLGMDRLVVVASTKKRAVELLNEAGRNYSMYAFNMYAGETGNTIQLALAEEGEGVWSEQGWFSHEYKRL